MMRSLIVTALLCSPALAAPGSSPPPQAAPPSVYRFDVSVAGIDATPATYTMVLAENRRGELSSGTNIAYPTAAGATSREQLGMELELSYANHNGVLFVEGEFEMSALVPSAGTSSPTWGRLHVKDLVVPVSPGKPTLLTSVYDVSVHRRYDVTITAQKLI
ncbi:MAG TPA: hypothetical protein VGG74_19630 [Kofleriaceae bacterium]|jgi:hypothetical protein